MFDIDTFNQTFKARKNAKDSELDRHVITDLLNQASIGDAQELIQALTVLPKKYRNLLVDQYVSPRGQYNSKQFGKVLIRANILNAMIYNIGENQRKEIQTKKEQKRRREEEKEEEAAKLEKQRIKKLRVEYADVQLTKSNLIQKLQQATEQLVHLTSEEMLLENIDIIDKFNEQPSKHNTLRLIKFL